jgi:hypothetical protein
MNFPDWSTYTFPAWATTDEAKAFLLGIIFGALVRIFRSALKWFKASGHETFD